MSWSIFVQPGATVSAARAAITADKTAPDTIKAYLYAGLDALVAAYGDAVLVFVSAHGHLHDGGPGSYTTANIDVHMIEGPK